MSTTDQTTFRDHTLVSSDGDEIGTIADVYYDDTTNDPEWLVVNPGMMRKNRLVPATDVTADAEGRIVSPHGKDLIMDAPEHTTEIYPDDAERQLAQQHYGLTG